MNTTLTMNERRVLSRRRSIFNRRALQERRQEPDKAREEEAAPRHDGAYDLMGSILAVAAGVIFVAITGLATGATSVTVQVLLIGAIICSFVIAFRRAFYL